MLSKNPKGFNGSIKTLERTPDGAVDLPGEFAFAVVFISGVAQLCRSATREHLPNGAV